MQAVRYTPSRALAPYVASCWEIKHNLPPDTTIAVPFSCTGRSHFVFSLESPFQCYDEAGQMEIAESTLFVQNTLPYTKHFKGPTLGITVDFTPTGLHTLWQLPVQKLSERSFDLTSVVTGDVRDLTDQMRDARSTAQRFALLENFLLQRLARANRMKNLRTDGRIEAAVAYIQQYPGHVNLQQLAYYLNCSERNFRRQFTEVVGVSPKYYVRMQRFMHTRRWLEQNPKPNWQDILSLAGYYDQAHLINEFKYFTGKSPLLYGAEPARLHDILFE